MAAKNPTQHAETSIRTPGYDPEIAQHIIRRLESQHPGTRAQVDRLLDATGARVHPAATKQKPIRPVVVEVSGDMGRSELRRFVGASATWYWLGVPFAIVHGSGDNEVAGRLKQRGAQLQRVGDLLLAPPEHVDVVRESVIAVGERLAEVLSQRYNVQPTTGVLEANAEASVTNATISDVQTPRIRKELDHGRVPIIGSIGEIATTQDAPLRVYVPRAMAFDAVAGAVGAPDTVPAMPFYEDRLLMRAA